jgi:DHA2 family multidrug resistance protein
MQLLGRSVTRQSAAIAFNDAFLIVVLLFACAAPVLVTIKIALARLGAEHRRGRPSQAH